jgi:hypothetical protein
MTKGNKPKTNVESGLYAGRKSFPGKDGLLKGDPPPGLATPDPTVEHNPGYCPEVPMARRSNDRHGVNPNFDVSDARKGNDAPSSKGGRESFPSPFSGASKATKAESDWSADYKPRSYKD